MGSKKHAKAVSRVSGLHPLLLDPTPQLKQKPKIFVPIKQVPLTESKGPVHFMLKSTHHLMAITVPIIKYFAASVDATGRLAMVMRVVLSECKSAAISLNAGTAGANRTLTLQK